mgnify:CR=1 FL=1|tara:strand:+ start:17623 stop:18255 length:633 start_codon:yes stop_codon:yes gene_type:complete
MSEIQKPQQPQLSSEEVLAKIVEKRKQISNRKTPKVFVKKKGDGFDYVDEAYMREQLNSLYPVWSWKIDKSEMLGAEWCIVTGTLSVYDAGVPRTFSSIGAARVQFKRGQEHTAENVVDIDKNVASANTNAFKRAINRLCNIADDIYQKNVKDVKLDEKQIEAIKSSMDGLDAKIQKDILQGIEDQTINTENINPVIDKIKRLKAEKEKK